MFSLEIHGQHQQANNSVIDFFPVSKWFGIGFMRVSQPLSLQPLYLVGPQQLEAKLRFSFLYLYWAIIIRRQDQWISFSTDMLHNQRVLWSIFEIGPKLFEVDPPPVYHIRKVFYQRVNLVGGGTIKYEMVIEPLIEEQ